MTAEEQAVVLVNEVRAEREQELWKGVGDRRGYGIVLEALCRAIEQHEAFRQEVSDVVLDYFRPYEVPSAFRHIIIWEPIPAPKPDPLVEVMEKLGWYNAPTDADQLRAALDALGFEIREKNDG